MGLIQTPDQLRFSYLAVIEGSKLIRKGSSTAQVVLKSSLCVCAAMVTAITLLSHRLQVLWHSGRKVPEPFFLTPQLS